MNSNPLQNLRDIHLPLPISWWPPAPGWYLLIILAVTSIALISYLFYRKIKKGRLKKISLKALEQLQSRYHQHPLETKHEIMIELSTLLKRAALSVYPRQQVASLSGKAWLKFLDQSGNTNEFSEGIGCVLLNGPYQSQTASKIDIDKLIKLMKQWMIKNV